MVIISIKIKKINGNNLYIYASLFTKQTMAFIFWIEKNKQEIEETKAKNPFTQRILIFLELKSAKCTNSRSAPSWFLISNSQWLGIFIWIVHWWLFISVHFTDLSIITCFYYGIIMASSIRETYVETLSAFWC